MLRMRYDWPTSSPLDLVSMIVSPDAARLPQIHVQHTWSTSARSSLIKLALITAVLLVNACSSLPKDVQRTPSSALENTSTTSLARKIRPMSDRHPSLSGFHILGDGADAFTARLRLIKAAEKSIDAQYYIWHDDLTGKVMTGVT